jgi:hypothetical protein
VATIAVDIPVASAAPEQAEGLLRACTIAAAPDRCEMASSSADAATAFAVVTWTGELSVKIDIGRAGASDWIERRMTFSPEDPALERWQAVGFAIGTLIGAAREKPAEATPLTAESSSTAQATAEKDTPVPAPPPTRPRGHAIRLDLLGRVGTATDTSARFGAGLAMTVQHGSGPFVSLEGSLDLADTSVGLPTTALAVRFATVGTTIGATIPISKSLHLDLGAGPLLEYQWLWTDRTEGDQSRLLGGVRATLGVRHRLGPRFWLGISTQMGARFGDTTINVDGERVDNVPLVFATAALAVGFDVWQR